ncbi:phosphonatase-like hydrolase [Streptomyces albiaxialis]|uniref:Phosphonatase-like hydrolase n=1 Tax=Streptomyces albiaxialis TaxID=329523 RepID=A0ABN2WJH5_9ACTN
MTALGLAVLDLAGTTVTDAGIVEDAFTHAVVREGVEEGGARHDRMMRYVRDTMGESKITVFRHLFDGDEETARRANSAFEEGYAQMVAAGRCAPLPGAREAIEELRAQGCAVVLNTGFSPRTRDDLLASLGWTGLADAVLSPADAGRGRPYPDMVLTALLRTGAPSVEAVAVVGDTPYDMRAGRAAGAGLVAGVLTGGQQAEDLRAAGADRVLGSVAELPALVRESARVPRPATVS